MLHATNPVPGVRCFEMKSGNGSSITWMRVPLGRVPDGDAGLKQQQRRAKIIACVLETTGAGVETLTRIIRTQRAIFTEAASRASVVSKQHLGVEATLQVIQSVNASWSGTRALKKLLGHLGTHLKLTSEVAVKEHVNEFTVPLMYFRVHLDADRHSCEESEPMRSCRAAAFFAHPKCAPFLRLRAPQARGPRSLIGTHTTGLQSKVADSSPLLNSWAVWTAALYWKTTPPYWHTSARKSRQYTAT